MKYDFEICQRVGIKHHATNAVSGLNTEGTDGSDIEDEITIMEVTRRAQLRRNNHICTEPSFFCYFALEQHRFQVSPHFHSKVLLLPSQAQLRKEN